MSACGRRRGVARIVQQGEGNKCKSRVGRKLQESGVEHIGFRRQETAQNIWREWHLIYSYVLSSSQRIAVFTALRRCPETRPRNRPNVSAFAASVRFRRKPNCFHRVFTASTHGPPAEFIRLSVCNGNLKLKLTTIRYNIPAAVENCGDESHHFW
jgi:hypothetical protein